MGVEPNCCKCGRVCWIEDGHGPEDLVMDFPCVTDQMGRTYCAACTQGR